MEELIKCISENMQLLANKTVELKAGISGGVIDEFLNVWGRADCYPKEEGTPFYDFVAGMKTDIEHLSLIDIYEGAASVIYNEYSYSFDEYSMLGLRVILLARLNIINALIRFEALRDNFDELEEFTKTAALVYYDNRLPENSAREYSMSLRILPPSSMDDVAAKIIKAATSLIPPFAILFGTLAKENPQFMRETDAVLESCIWPCLIFAGVGFLIGFGICEIINSKKIKERNKVKLANEMEIERWEKEVTQAFYEKAKDIKFLYEKIDEYIVALRKLDSSLFEYMSQTFGFIPEKYLFDLEAIDSFYDYIKDRRVDSMKEAINLYVAEKDTAEYRERQIRVQEDIAAAEERIAGEAKRKNDIYQREVAEQIAYNSQLLKGLEGVAFEIEKSNKIEAERREKISELSSKVGDVKSELEKISKY